MQESEKAKKLGLDLQRKEEDTSDLREKLADCKKQIQQVQKEVCGNTAALNPFHSCKTKLHILC